MEKRDNAFLLNILTALSVTVLISSNVMSVKVLAYGDITLFDAGTLLFPLDYVLGNVIAELWGFKTARRVISVTFACAALFTAATFIPVLLPSPESGASVSAAYNEVFNYAPRVILASFAAFFLGSLCNAAALGGIRRLTGEKHLWVRTLFSSVIGHMVDTVIFAVTAFAGRYPFSDVLSIILSQYFLKLLIDAAVSTPLVYAVKRKLGVFRSSDDGKM